MVSTKKLCISLSMSTRPPPTSVYKQNTRDFVQMQILIQQIWDSLTSSPGDAADTGPQTMP